MIADDFGFPDKEEIARLVGMTVGLVERNDAL
jgi:hypothetical protein